MLKYIYVITYNQKPKNNSFVIPSIIFNLSYVIHSLY